MVQMPDREQLIDVLQPFMGEGSIPERYSYAFAGECADAILAIATQEEPTSENRFRGLLAEIAVSGVEHDDPRIGYVSVQIVRPVWEEIVASWTRGELRMTTKENR